MDIAFVDDLVLSCLHARGYPPFLHPFSRLYIVRQLGRKFLDIFLEQFEFGYLNRFL